MTDADRINALREADDVYPLLDHHLAETIGHRLFTLFVIDWEGRAAARVYSSQPEAYPVKGRKPMGELTVWSETVLDQGQPFIGSDAADIRATFPDHETIAALGCESVLIVPVVSDGVTIGTMNLLHEAGWYGAGQAARALPFASLLVGPYRRWISG